MTKTCFEIGILVIMICLLFDICHLRDVFRYALCLCPMPFALRLMLFLVRNPQHVTRNPKPETLIVVKLQRLYQCRQGKIHRCFQTEPFGLANDKPIDGSNFCLSPVIYILSHG